VETEVETLATDLDMETRGWQTRDDKLPNRSEYLGDAGQNVSVTCDGCGERCSEYMASDGHWHECWHLDGDGLPCERITGPSRGAKRGDRVYTTVSMWATVRRPDAHKANLVPPGTMGDVQHVDELAGTLLVGFGPLGSLDVAQQVDNFRFMADM